MGNQRRQRGGGTALPMSFRITASLVLVVALFFLPFPYAVVPDQPKVQHRRAVLN